MPYDRPGNIFYPPVATKAVNHGEPTIEAGVPGVAIKQKSAAAAAGAGTPQKQIAIGEAFAMKVKGIVQIAVGASGATAKGDPVYITTANNALAATSGAGKVKFGVVVEVAGQRGTPTAMMRVDLDLKSLLA